MKLRESRRGEREREVLKRSPFPIPIFIGSCCCCCMTGRETFSWTLHSPLTSLESAHKFVLLPPRVGNVFPHLRNDRIKKRTFPSLSSCAMSERNEPKKLLGHHHERT